MTETNFMGNVSTIAVWIWVIVSPYIASYITQDQFTSLFVAVIGIIIAVYSSYHPNNFEFLNNGKNSCNCADDSVEQILNDEYETSPNDQDGC